MSRLTPIDVERAARAPRSKCRDPIPRAREECTRRRAPGLREDGKHSWHFDGDDPRVVCFYCGEIRDVITGRRIR